MGAGYVASFSRPVLPGPQAPALFSCALLARLMVNSTGRSDMLTDNVIKRE